MLARQEASSALASVHGQPLAVNTKMGSKVFIALGDTEQSQMRTGAIIWCVAIFGAGVLVGRWSKRAKQNTK